MNLTDWILKSVVNALLMTVLLAFLISPSRNLFPMIPYIFGIELASLIFAVILTNGDIRRHVVKSLIVAVVFSGVTLIFFSPSVDISFDMLFVYSFAIQIIGLVVMNILLYSPKAPVVRV